ncbi:alpha/beta hydrolase [Candidatus Uabimicrobium sp. HlEnr_7]|uniref:alpha/beta hydrolase n=1 Tax=Candidatus Uabimicrobium helgolandensis TaxID=3095367 RepID=UPI003557D654
MHVQKTSLELPGERAAFLLLHGFTGLPDEMCGLAKFLNEKGFHVSVPLLAGHGTTPEDLATTTWKDWENSANEALIELEKLNIPIFIIGVCAGGLLAYTLASKKQKIAGLVSMAAFYELPGYFKYIAPFFRVLNWHKFKPTFDKRMKPESLPFAYPVWPTPCITSARDLVFATKKILPTIKQPTLLVYSERDRVAGLKHFKYVKKHLRNSPTCLLLQSAGHMVIKGSQKEKIFNEILSFVDDKI